MHSKPLKRNYKIGGLRIHSIYGVLQLTKMLHNRNIELYAKLLRANSTIEYLRDRIKILEYESKKQQRIETNAAKERFKISRAKGS